MKYLEKKSNSQEKWRNNLKILIQEILNGKKLILTALIGKDKLGKDPKKNFSVLEFLPSIPFLLWASCGHNYLLINILMSENPVSIPCWGFTVKTLKEEKKCNTPPFTF